MFDGSVWPERGEKGGRPRTPLARATHELARESTRRRPPPPGYRAPARGPVAAPSSVSVSGAHRRGSTPRSPRDGCAPERSSTSWQAAPQLQLAHTSVGGTHFRGLQADDRSGAPTAHSRAKPMARNLSCRSRSSTGTARFQRGSRAHPMVMAVHASLRYGLSPGHDRDEVASGASDSPLQPQSAETSSGTAANRSASRP